VTVPAARSSPPLLSIVIPVLNASRDLPTCLAAIARQSTADHLYEVIAVDGGSTDETRKIAEQAGARVVDNPLRLAEPGVAIGIQSSRGELVTIIAADNWMRGTDFIERMIEPFAEKDIMAAFPRVVGRSDDGIANKYVARYADPFTHFVYGTRGSSFDAMLERSSRSGGQRYGKVMSSIGRHPLLAVAQGCTVRRSVYDESPSMADDVLPIVGIIEARGALALVGGAELEHHHVAGLGSFYRKYRYRVRSGLQGQQGFLRRRSALSSGRRFRTWLWLPYSATLVPPLIHGLVMSIRRRDPVLLYHPILNAIVFAAVCREVFSRGGEAVAARVTAARRSAVRKLSLKP
jgi:glycosyltransferase involved in cell wall biosynthesis